MVTYKARERSRVVLIQIPILVELILFHEGIEVDLSASFL